MSMNLKLISHPVFLDNTKANEIFGYANGCFAISATNAENQPVFFLFNQKGECQKANLHVRQAMLLNDNSYITIDYPDKPKLFDNFVTLHAPDGTPVKKYLAAAEIYVNGWYRLNDGEHNELYTDKHELVAKNFSQCFVHNKGYAIRTNHSYYKFADWHLFDKEGQIIGSCNTVAKILGDGFPLAYDLDERCFLLYDQSGKELLVRNVEEFQTFPNGRFVLVITPSHLTGKDNRYIKIFDTAGTSFTALDDGSICLPDGRFLCYFSSRAFALYGRNGIMVSSPLWWQYQLAGNYYLLHVNDVNTLFNDKQEDLGEGYVLEAVAGNFTLLKNEGAFHLFNQYGHVLSLPYDD